MRLILVLLGLGLFLQPVRLQAFQWVTIQYRSGDWYNSRQGVELFLKQLQSRTTINVEQNIKELPLDDERLFEYAFIFINGHVPIVINDREKEFLRRFIQNGGFVFINDDYGIDESVRKIIAEVFPGMPLKEIPFTHPIYHCFYQFPQGIPKIHEHDGGRPQALGLFQGDRLVLFYAFNTDIADGWDPPSVHNDPDAIRESAIRMGINIVVYALSH